MITQEKIQETIFFNLFYFFFGGGGGEGGIAKLLKLAVNRRTKFRNTHWLEKSLATVDDKPRRLFSKTSLNARE